MTQATIKFHMSSGVSLWSNLSHPLPSNSYKQRRYSLTLYSRIIVHQSVEILWVFLNNFLKLGWELFDSPYAICIFRQAAHYHGLASASHSLCILHTFHHLDVFCEIQCSLFSLCTLFLTKQKLHEVISVNAVLSKLLLRLTWRDWVVYWNTVLPALPCMHQIFRWLK